MNNNEQTDIKPIQVLKQFVTGKYIESDIPAAAYEYLMFRTSIQLPFFSKLLDMLSDKLGPLFKHLLSYDEENRISPLTAEEAFEFLLMLKKGEVRAILEQYDDCTPSIFNGIIDSINDVDYNTFSMLVPQLETLTFFRALALLRLVLTGYEKGRIFGQDDFRRSNWRGHTLWLDQGIMKFLYEEEDMEEKQKLVLAKILGIVKEYPGRAYDVEAPTGNGVSYYNGWGWGEDKSPNELQSRVDKVVLKYVYKECESDIDRILRNYCFVNTEVAEKIIYELSSDRKTKKLENTSDDSKPQELPSSQIKWLNQETSRRPRKKQQLKCFETAGELQERYYSERQLDSYVEVDGEGFCNYILLLVVKMSEILQLLQGVLLNDEYSKLNMEVENSPYGKFFRTLYRFSEPSRNEGYSFAKDKLDEEQYEKCKPQIKEDKVDEHKEWFVKVLRSKTHPNGNIVEKNQILYNCLFKLYNMLCQEGYLCYDEYKRGVFIYRFSGLYTDNNVSYSPDDSCNLLEWQGRDMVLKYLVRCLISDKRNNPKGLKNFSKYFKKEKQWNWRVEIPKELSTEEATRNTWNTNLRNAVKMLEECDFENVEKISKRPH